MLTLMLVLFLTLVFWPKKKKVTPTPTNHVTNIYVIVPGGGDGDSKIELPMRPSFTNRIAGR